MVVDMAAAAEGKVDRWGEEEVKEVKGVEEEEGAGVRPWGTTEVAQGEGEVVASTTAVEEEARVALRSAIMVREGTLGEGTIAIVPTGEVGRL